MALRKTSEDLFETTRMSFGEHLEELRKVLLRSLVAIAIGTCFGMYFSKEVVEILKAPLVNAANRFEKEQGAKRLSKQLGWLAPDLQPWLENDRRSPKSVFVDPGQLVGALRSVSPDFLEGVHLDAYQLVPKNFKPDQISGMCQRLVDPSKELPTDAERILAIWGLLSEARRAEITRMAEQPSISEADVKLLAAIFNEVVSERSLNESEAFASLMTAPPKSGFWIFGETKSNPLHEMRQSLDNQYDPDLNRRLNRTLIAAVFSQQMQPLKLDLVPLEIWEEIDVQPQSLSVTEPFMIWMKAGLVTGLLLSSPFVFWQFWSFVASGLYPHEKSYVHLYLPMSLFLFFGGILLAYFYVFDPVLQFLFSFNADLGISLETRINDWLGFVMVLPLGFGAGFQLPLIMLFLNRIGIFSVEVYLQKWRIAIMVIFVVAMVLTPAEPSSMLLMAAPMTMLYFVGIALCKWMPGHKRSPFAEISEPA